MRHAMAIAPSWRSSRRSSTSHPLAAYVEYWQLVPRLRTRSGVVTQVEEFLARYPETYIADRLRLDWALALADRGDFTGFEREAAQTRLEHRRQPVALLQPLSRYRNASGSQLDVLARDARQLLANTRDSAGEGCLALTEALLADSRISVWERVRALVEQNQLPTAKRDRRTRARRAGQTRRPEAAGAGDRSPGRVPRSRMSVA